MTDIKFESLVGKTIKSIEIDENKETVTFADSDGAVYQMTHYQNCCERVRVEDVIGDLEDLIGNPILQAEEVLNENGDPAPEYPESWTWTFYKLATIKGGVTIRWLGESNGYYSERVDFVQVSP